MLLTCQLARLSELEAHYAGEPLRTRRPSAKRFWPIRTGPEPRLAMAGPWLAKAGPAIPHPLSGPRQLNSPTCRIRANDHDQDSERHRPAARDSQ